ncbi:MAG: TVP38/TMEM64 family protein [bacterium]|nr:TVP38/TMEM64 family protein [bacterium]
MKKTFKKLIIFILIVAVILLVEYLYFGNYFTLESLKNDKDFLQNYVSQNYLSSVFIYIAIYILSISFFVPDTAVLVLAGGYLFGVIPCAIYVNIAVTIGSGIAFLICRYLFGEWWQKIYKDKLVEFNYEVNKNGYLYLLTMRLMPVFPYFLVNILAALTTIPFITFIWTTSVGILPGTLIYAFAGSQLNTISSLKDIFSLKIIFAFSMLAFLPFFCAEIKNRMHKKI